MYIKKTLQHNQQKTLQGQPFLNSFIQNNGFYKVGQVLFLFIDFFGERQKIVPFTKLTTIQQVKRNNSCTENYFYKWNPVFRLDQICCVTIDWC